MGSACRTSPLSTGGRKRDDSLRQISGVLGCERHTDRLRAIERLVALQPLTAIPNRTLRGNS